MACRTLRNNHTTGRAGRASTAFPALNHAQKEYCRARWGRSVHHQDGHLGMEQDLGGPAAQQEARDAATPVRSHHDEIALAAPGSSYDLLERLVARNAHRGTAHALGAGLLRDGVQ